MTLLTRLTLINAAVTGLLVLCLGLAVGMAALAKKSTLEAAASLAYLGQHAADVLANNAAVKTAYTDMQGDMALVLNEMEIVLWVGGIGVLVGLILAVGGTWLVRHNLVAALGQLVRALVQGESTVKIATTEVSGAVMSLTAASEETSRQSEIVLHNSAEAAGHTGQVSRAVEELNQAIHDISKSITETNSCVEHAVAQMESTQAVVSRLEKAAVQIDEVVNVITTLSEQTNLLALNAAIEAARAGEAGRGFAVVADEVKKLATDTGKATEGVRAQVKEVQTVANECSASLEAMRHSIMKVMDNTGAVSSAVEEQSGVAKQITASVNEAAERVGQVETNMVGIKQAAGDTGIAAHQVSGGSKSLNDAFGSMSTQLHGVISAIGGARLAQAHA